MTRSFASPTVLRAAAAVLAAGCATSEGGGTELLVPDTVPVDWDASYNQVDDGLGALVTLDVMAYDGNNGLPLPDVSVVVLVDEDEAVVAVPVVDAAFTDGASSEEDVLWDSRHDQYLTLHPPSDTDGGHLVPLTTDDTGLARWYLFVDAFPSSGRGFGPIPLTVSSNGTDETFLLLPQ